MQLDLDPFHGRSWPRLSEAEQNLVFSLAANGV